MGIFLLPANLQDAELISEPHENTGVDETVQSAENTGGGGGGG